VPGKIGQEIGHWLLPPALSTMSRRASFVDDLKWHLLSYLSISRINLKRS
jgi:hypothetical protein